MNESEKKNEPVKKRLLAVSSGNYVITDKNTGEVTKTGTAHYVIYEQSDRCKPIISKCSKELKEKASRLKDQYINTYFDERGNLIEVTPCN